MKKFIILLFVSLLLQTVFNSCITKQRCSERYPCPEINSISTNTSIKEDIRDTTLYTKTDTGLVIAMLKCDSLGNVYVSRIIALEGVLDSQPPFLDITDNILKVAMPVDSIAVYAKLKDRYTTTSKSELKTIVKEVNVLTGFQCFQIWLGRFLLVLLLLAIIYVVLKFSLKHPF
jgi:hypothetical protein